MTKTVPGDLPVQSEAIRLEIMHLAEQAAGIAERLKRITDDAGGTTEVTEDASVFRLDAPENRDDAETILSFRRSTRPPLPDPNLVRLILRHRQLRARFFGSSLFADPAWDMLLDLTAAQAEHKRVSVTSLCVASGVPPTTALRWITQMTDEGLVKRVEDEIDHRRAFVVLTDKAANAMAHYFAERGNDRERMV